MQGKIKFAQSSFRQTLDRYILQTGKDIAKVLHTKATYVIYGAANYTKMADKGQIR